jgi:hypothetical protein
VSAQVSLWKNSKIVYLGRMSHQAQDSKDIAAQGSAIYERRYRAEFEPKWLGRYAAIDVDSERAFVEDFPEVALGKARAALPDSMFYLVRIGSPGAFKLSRRAFNANPRLI